MTLLYRCPRCSSVIERSSEWDELARLAPQRAVFECGICGNIMSAADVLSGSYDLVGDKAQIPAGKLSIRERLRKLMRSSSTSVSNKEIPLLHELLPQLKHEHNGGCVYRGQTKLWPGPLVPSAYRGIVNSTEYSGWKPSMRLRGTGSTFYEEVPLRSNDAEKAKQLRIAHYPRLLFGYPMAQVLGQHYGFTSEGLDVTNDPDVAAFFASFDFRNRRFTESDQESGIIYRFTVRPRTHSLAAFRTYNLLGCP